MSKGRILVVDMNEETHEIASKVAGPKGLAVASGRTGPEGLALAKEVMPAMMVLDRNIPEIGAPSLIRILRKHAPFRDVPAIFLDHRESMEIRLGSYAQPFDRYLPHPFTIHDLDEAVSAVLEISRNVDAGSAGWTMDDLQFTQSLEGSRGSFEDIGVGPLLGYLELERRSGELVLLYREGEERTKARIFFQAGRVHRARIEGRGEPKNEALIRALLDVPKGKFDFRPRNLEIRDEIGKPVSALIGKG